MVVNDVYRFSAVEPVAKARMVGLGEDEDEIASVLDCAEHRDSFLGGPIRREVEGDVVEEVGLLLEQVRVRLFQDGFEFLLVVFWHAIPWMSLRISRYQSLEAPMW